ncbi:MAG: GntR family transcriptional regulator [Pseudomonadota bacterium]
MVFKPALNITDQIADFLGNQIIEGHLLPGERVQELRLAKALSVSRGTIREALLILERRHLIEIAPRKGAVVIAIQGEEAGDLLEMLCATQQRWFSGQARLSAAQRSDAEAALEQMADAARGGDAAALVTGRGAFYTAILAGSNRYIGAVFECLLPSSQRLLWQLLAQERIEAWDIARFYRALFDAYVGGASERAVELLVAFARRQCQLSRDLRTDVDGDAQGHWYERASSLAMPG